MTAKQHT